MREPIVTYDDPNLEHNMWGPNYLKYKGNFFTGTLVEEDTNPNSYVEYKNGDYDGDAVSYHRNGTLAAKSVYKDGEYISGKEWYDNGQLKSDDIHLYDNKGKLIRINGSWLYPNGIKRNSQGDGEYYLFSSKGELAIKTIVKKPGENKNTIIYTDAILSDCFQELLINLYPDFDNMSYNAENHIWGWVAKKYSIDKSKGLELYRTLERHPNQSIARTAKNLIEKIEKNEFDAEKYLSNLGYHTILE